MIYVLIINPTDFVDLLTIPVVLCQLGNVSTLTC